VQTSILQAASIVMTGNAVLQGWDAGEWWPKASVFTFCNRVAFIDGTTGLFRQPKRIADNPRDFLQTVAALDGALRLRLDSRTGESEDRETAGFSGRGSRWMIEVVSPGSSDLWEAEWTFRERNRAKGGWAVEYHRVTAIPPLVALTARDSDAFDREVHDALTGIAGFARSQNIDNFAAIFERALAAFEARSATRPAHAIELAPQGFLDQEAMRLLDVAQAAWVFGGMGSWNDVGWFEDPAVVEAYQAWSDRLFAALQQAVLIAANSTYAVTSGRATLFPS